MSAILTVVSTLLVLAGLVPAQLPPSVAVGPENERSEVMTLLNVQAGMTAADVGAGSGTWSETLARAVGEGGRVYATELGTSELAALRRAIQSGGSTNIVVLEGAAHQTNLPRECCDVILLRRVYHHLTHPHDMARSLVVALKTGGRLAIIDSRPPPSSGTWPALIGHSIDPDVVRSHFENALTHVTTVEPWVTPDRYLLLFTRP